MVASEIAHAYSFFTRCKNSAEKKKGSIRRVLQRHGCDPICQRAALFVASTKHQAATSIAIFSEFVETFVSLTHTQAALPLPAPFKLGIWNAAPPADRTPAYEGTGVAPSPASRRRRLLTTASTFHFFAKCNVRGHGASVIVSATSESREGDFLCRRSSVHRKLWLYSRRRFRPMSRQPTAFADDALVNDQLRD